ncbi:MAG: AsmA family protein, partial [Pseudomonadota bacterium]
MKRIFYIGAAALLVVLIGLASAPFLVPASLYKERIETAASDALGRKVTLTGEMKLSLIPRIEARAGATVIENPEGFGDAPFASMTELRAAVKLLPLLSSRVEIDEFVLVDPKINLIRLENGDANWEFGSEEAPAPEETGEGGQGGGDFAAILGDVRLVNGEITYNDYTTGASHALESLDVRVKMDALDKPLSINGDGVLDGLDFELSTRVDDTKAILDGETSPVSLDLETDLVSGEIEGEITGGDTINLDLSANVSMPSVLDAAAFFGVSDLPAATALGEVSLEGLIVGAPGDLSIEDLVFTHASDLLTTSFNGGARIADTLSFSGRVDLDAPDLKALAASADAELPEGDAYRRFAFSGDASGGATNISLT